MPDLKEELIVTYLIQKVSSAMLCFLIVFSHEFVKVIGKANVKELAMEETWWKKNICSKHDFCLDVFCLSFGHHQAWLLDFLSPRDCSCMLMIG